MLRLINVCKSYKFGKNREVILDNINIDFKKNELVFILGKSGSGKSTLLNIIGGLIDIDSGKVMLDDRDISCFNNKMFCNYRNSMVGFIFQNYHLVEYMSVIDNIKLGMTVKSNSGDIENILRKLGIYSKRRSLVNKLSGGEKQRVAIARAIINNPDIILCDEPTGALDSSNGDKIMRILKDISKNKLVIVVSHDKELAFRYGDRIINIDDGKVDYYPQVDCGRFRDIGKNKISFFNVFKMSIKNLLLKKGRTFFTSLAVSIGLICMMLVLCLSKSFNDDIDNLEREIVSSFPISIYNGEYEIIGSNKISSNSKIIRKNRDDYIHVNKINNSYIDYVKKIDGVNYINYEYDISMPIISDRYKFIDNGYMKIVNNDFIIDNYDILYGDNINGINDILLKVDSNNNVDSNILDMFNIDSDIEYSDLVGRELRVILNDLYYVKNGDYYYVDNDLEKLYKNSDIVLRIVGIVREKEIVDDNSYIFYDNGLIDYVIGKNRDSEIVRSQIDSDYNVLGLDMDRYELLSYLGYDSLPIGMNIYVSNIDNKDMVVSMLDKYNIDNDKLIYVDTMKDAIDILKNIINIISVILIIFSFICIIISSLMIFILTNNRVIERVREIGILRSLGARNKDISRLFNIENFIIGLISSCIGLFVIYILVEPINSLMYGLLDINGIFKIDIFLIIISIVFNIFVILLSGYIPAFVASRRDIIDCLK